MTTRICVADGVAAARAAVCEVLSREEGFEVIEASDRYELELALDTSPDIVLIDAALPPIGAREAVAQAKGRCGSIIVWSVEPEQDEVLAAVRAGATGYLRKEISPAGLVRSLRGAAKGESPLARDLAALLIGAIHTDETAARSRELARALSLREREVLDHVAQGSLNKQIAAALTISEFTVKRHVQNILHKLELPSRRAAAVLYSSTVEAVARGERAGVQ